MFSQRKQIPLEVTADNQIDNTQANEDKTLKTGQLMR